MFSVQAARLGIQVNTHHQWILEKKVNKQKIADESKVFLEYYDTKKPCERTKEEVVSYYLPVNLCPGLYSSFYLGFLFYKSRVFLPSEPPAILYHY